VKRRLDLTLGSAFEIPVVLIPEGVTATRGEQIGVVINVVRVIVDPPGERR